MTAGRPTYTAAVDGVPLTVLAAGRAALDESWTPYAQVSGLEVKNPGPELLAVMDPRRRPRPRLTLSAVMSYVDSDRVADVTAAWAGWTAAGVTAGFSTAGSVTAAFGTPLEGSVYRAPTSLRVSLPIITADLDAARDVVVVAAASDEVILQDGALVSTTPVSTSSGSVRTAVNYVLAYLTGSALQPGPDYVIDVADSFVWEPGQSGWEFVSHLVSVAGMRLWCDDDGLWWMDYAATARGDYRVLRPADSTDWTERFALEEYADAYVIRYEWTDAAGVGHVSYDAAGPANATRTMTETVRRRYPGRGLAAARLARRRGRGHTITAAAMARYDLRPDDMVRAAGSAGQDVSGLLSRVEYDLAESTVSLSTHAEIDLADGAIDAFPPTVMIDALTGVIDALDPANYQQEV